MPLFRQPPFQPRSSRLYVPTKAPVGVVSASPGVVTWAGVTAAINPIINSVPLVNNTGTVLASLAVTVFIYTPATGALVLTKSLTTNAGGIWSVSDPTFTRGNSYRCVTVFTVSGAEGMDTYMAA